MAHALRAWLHLLGTEPAGIPVARAALDAAWKLPATAQEQGHLTAIEPSRSTGAGTRPRR